MRLECVIGKVLTICQQSNAAHLENIEHVIEEIPEATEDFLF